MLLPQQPNLNVIERKFKRQILKPDPIILARDTERLPPSLILFRGQSGDSPLVCSSSTVLLVSNYSLWMKTHDRCILPKLPNSCLVTMDKVDKVY